MTPRQRATTVGASPALTSSAAAFEFFGCSAWSAHELLDAAAVNYDSLVPQRAIGGCGRFESENFGDAINKSFKLGRDLNQRDTIAVKHTISGLLKLLDPNECLVEQAASFHVADKGRNAPVAASAN